MIGFQEICCPIIFDVKMNFTRKARFVAGGHTTDTPVSITYSSVVSRDSVRLAFLIAGLNDLDVLAGDVTNAYLNASCREKIWFEGGVETGEHRGKVLIVTHALYGHKSSSSAAWRADLAAMLCDLKFTTSSQADLDIWIRSSGTHYDMVASECFGSRRSTPGACREGATLSYAECPPPIRESFSSQTPWPPLGTSTPR